MTDACFILDDVQVPVGGLLHLAGPEGRHAAKVRRIRVGESVLVMDGRGQAVRGIAEAIGDDFVDIRVGERLIEPVRQHRWIAVQALAKGDRGEQSIQAMTELGVDEVIAWQAARSVVRWQGKADKGLAKWASAVREASKQTRRFSIPTVSYATTEQVCARIAAADRAIVLHESAAHWLGVEDMVTSGDVLFIVGPEGGIAPDELAAFEQAGACVALIATNVLRNSTAGVVALSQLQLLARSCDFAQDDVSTMPSEQ